MNANTEFSGRIIEVDYERSTLLVRYEGAPPEIGSHLAPIAANGPEHTDWGRAALLWVLWHHQGGSSPVGQPIRFALGMGQHDHLSEHQVAEAKRWAELTSTRAVAPTPAPKPLNGIAANQWHDEGARARCSDCGRYTLNPEALTVATHRCECGSRTGWSGSFKRPGPNAKWSGAAPGVALPDMSAMSVSELKALAKRVNTALDAACYGASAGLMASHAPGWRSIESAPKDGSWIVARGHLQNGTPDTLRWQNEAWRNGLDGFEYEPTHWSPVPADGVQGTQPDAQRLFKRPCCIAGQQTEDCIGCATSGAPVAGGDHAA